MRRPHWYTVPHEYGGLSLPLWRRIWAEYNWRRYGRAGLEAVVFQGFERFVAQTEQALADLTASMNEASVAIESSLSHAVGLDD